MSADVYHQPGTPLPWNESVSQSENLYIVGPKNDGTDTKRDRVCKLPRKKPGEGVRNMHYIAVSGMAYPRLVTMSKNLLKHCPRDMRRLEDCETDFERDVFALQEYLKWLREIPK